MWEPTQTGIQSHARSRRALLRLAVGGAATEAALRAVAEALGMPRRSVVLISGATSRDKVLGVSSETPDTLRELVRELLG